MGKYFCNRVGKKNNYLLNRIKCFCGVFHNSETPQKPLNLFNWQMFHYKHRSFS